MKRVILIMLLATCLTTPYTANAEVFNQYPNQVINDTNKMPYSAVCRITAYYPDGSSKVATGFLVGRKKVCTVAHVVRDRGQIPLAVKVVPGGGKTFWARRISVPKGFKWTINAKYLKYDKSYLTLDKKVNSDYFRVKPSGRLKQAICWINYDTGQMIKSSGPVERSERLTYNMDTLPGSSGAPVYYRVGKRYYATGVNVCENQSYNSAVRFNRKEVR